MYYNFDISDKILRTSETALEKAKASFSEIDRITEQNQIKVLSGFTEFGISESHFAGTTGYGYGDRGRERLRGCSRGICQRLRRRGGRRRGSR